MLVAVNRAQEIQAVLDTVWVLTSKDGTPGFCPLSEIVGYQELKALITKIDGAGGEALVKALMTLGGPVQDNRPQPVTGPTPEDDRAIEGEVVIGPVMSVGQEFMQGRDLADESHSADATGCP